VQGLNNERVQTIVRAKGEAALLSECIDVVMEDESAILSAKEFAAPQAMQERNIEDPVEDLASYHKENIDDLVEDKLASLVFM
jgi:hypothetical protein